MEQVLEEQTPQSLESEQEGRSHILFSIEEAIVEGKVISACLNELSKKIKDLEKKLKFSETSLNFRFNSVQIFLRFRKAYFNVFFGLCLQHFIEDWARRPTFCVLWAGIERVTIACTKKTPRTFNDTNVLDNTNTNFIGITLLPTHSSCIQRPSLEEWRIDLHQTRYCLFPRIKLELWVIVDIQCSFQFFTSC